jgi:hypothetical protein
MVMKVRGGLAVGNQQRCAATSLQSYIKRGRRCGWRPG